MMTDDLARRFAFHARIYAGDGGTNSSPLYAALSAAIANDPAILALVQHADRHTQVSNLLFAAVHDLLLAGADHLLRAFYASLTQNPGLPAEAYPVFRAFCLQHATAITERVATQRVQTNEVGRCSTLLPAFGLVAQCTDNRPLALIEIGASAGLNLHWDRYGYDYGSAGRVGDPAAPVQLVCWVEDSAHRLPISGVMPMVVGRIGIDLHPITLDDPAATRWLQALIWPEQTDRARLLEAALATARSHPVTILAGDAAERLPDAVAQLPTEATLCVYHSYTLNQCPPPVRTAILQAIDTLAQTRPLWRVSLEWFAGQPRPQLELYAPSNGAARSIRLAECESHGRSIAWQHSDV
ncbi:MAG: DUF2332 domain-containing protein [Chloroflexales bacterium]|nr:DUF2332 domain-containing protein [Chloroflexales bacterium]